MGRVIRIGLGEGVVGEPPQVLASVGIGCCVVLTLHDPGTGLGGMAHILLPDSSQVMEKVSPFACADTALLGLLQELLLRGARRGRLVAKLAGGARMFPKVIDDYESIGRQNIARLRRLLGQENLPLAGHDLGGHHGRSVEFDLTTGRLRVSSIDLPDREF